VTNSRIRLKGDARSTMAADLAREYRTTRVAIRPLAATYGLSYGLVRALLLEEKVKLRPRNSGKPRAKADTVRT